MSNDVTRAVQYVRDIHSRRAAPRFQEKRRVALNRVSVRLTTWSFMFIISAVEAYDTVPRGSKITNPEITRHTFPPPNSNLSRGPRARGFIFQIFHLEFCPEV